MLSAEFKSARTKRNKVSAWNLYQSEVKADIPDHIRCPIIPDGLRPKFTGEYAKVVAEQWSDRKDEYKEKARNINEAGGSLSRVPMVLRQKRTLKKLKELVRHQWHLSPSLSIVRYCIVQSMLTIHSCRPMIFPVWRPQSSPMWSRPRHLLFCSSTTVSPGATIHSLLIPVERSSSFTHFAMAPICNVRRRT